MVLVRFLEVAVGEWVYKLASRCCPGAAMLLSAFRYKKSLSEDCYFSEALPSPSHLRLLPIPEKLKRCFAPGGRQVEVETDFVAFAGNFGCAAEVEKPAVAAVAVLVVDLVRCLGGKRQAVPLPAVYRCSLIQFKIF